MLRCTSRNMQLNNLFAQVSECMGVKAELETMRLRMKY